jgi:hypothetical protein
MMFLRGLFTILVSMIAAGHCLAAPTPEDIITAFFGPSGISNKAAYYTGEMKERFSNEPTLGQSLKPGVTIKARLLPLSQREAPVYAVDLRVEGLVDNWYAFFSLDGNDLKLRAVRTLGLTGIPYAAMDGLKKLPSRTAEQEWTYQNLKLLFQPDGELIAYFRTQIGELDRLATMIGAQSSDFDAKNADAKNAAAIRVKIRSMHLSGWERDQYGHITIWVGGILNSTAGVMYVPDDKPPSLSENEYIYIEHIDGPWYLYKST